MGRPLTPARISRWVALALLSVAVVVYTWPARAAGPGTGQGFNILFIASDDLRCDLACYGNAQAKTPNLDRLAQQGRLFKRAYCQQALCNPSRSSLMTGLRPEHTGISNNQDHFRSNLPEAITLPQLFMKNGYFAQGIGKIYHNYGTKIEGDPASWSVPQQMHWGIHYWDCVVPGQPWGTQAPRGPATQCLDVPDEAYLDGRIAKAAVAALKELKDKRFFLAVGFWKPHLPYNAPKKYWDLYDRKSLSGPNPPARPSGAPDVAFHRGAEVRGYTDIPKNGPVPADKTAELRHGYLAGISFMDANVGKLLAELDRLQLREKTIVVFWGDNGFHLGDHAQWGKETDFEIAARVPLIISVPGQGRAGQSSTSLVELVDLYPTLVDLCGLKAASKLDGKSLRPILDNPEAAIKEAVFTQCPHPKANQAEFMGLSVRTTQFRYTEWRGMTNRQVMARELYKYGASEVESTNVADHAEFAGVISKHKALLAGSGTAEAEGTGLAPVLNREDPKEVPGVIIDHSPASSGLYIGSPSLAALPNGHYLASHDLFGPKSAEFECPTTVVFRSSDRGASWKEVARVKCAFWGNLFVHRGAVYLMGTDKHHGRIVIRRSTDGGTTWSEPRDAHSGLLTAEGQYHTAPMPVIDHDGRLWRAFEDAMGGTEWGKRYRAMMLSVPTEADLLNAANWTFSAPLARDPTWLSGDCNAWLEGNAVLTPDGRIVDMLRVDNSAVPEKAALVQISSDGRKASFDPRTGFVDFPGAAKKFTIRFDPLSKRYWSVVTPALKADLKPGKKPAGIRNTLALASSPDLRNWDMRCVLLHHPDTAKHGFQYVDWLFEGKDIIAACRTAFDDAEGGAHNNHDANYLTFHRLENFAELRGSGSPLH